MLTICENILGPKLPLACEPRCSDRGPHSGRSCRAQHFHNADDRVAGLFRPSASSIEWLVSAVRDIGKSVWCEHRAFALFENEPSRGSKAAFRPRSGQSTRSDDGIEKRLQWLDVML